MLVNWTQLFEVHIMSMKQYKIKAYMQMKYYLSQ